MRLFLVFTALACLLASCGGDEYSSTPTTGQTQPGQPAAQPAAQPTAEPEKPKETLSPLAATLNTQLRMAQRAGDAGPARALADAEKYASQATGDSLFYLAELWKLGGKPKEAADAYVAFVAACPTDKNYKWGLYGAGEMLLKTERAEEAAKYADTFAQKAPEEMKYAAALSELVGIGLLKEGKFDAAVKMFQRAADGGRQYAGENLVSCLCVAGRYDEAKQQATKFAGEYTGKLGERYQTIAARVGKMGSKAPELDVEGWTGQTEFDLSSIDGKVTLIYFWSMPSWALAKRTEEALGPLYDRYKDEGFEIIGLSKHNCYDPTKTPHKQDSMTTEEEIAALDVWARGRETFKTPWRLGLCEDDRNHDAFGYAGVVPTFVLLDRKGNFRWYLQGESKPREENYALLAKVIEILLDEK